MQGFLASVVIEGDARLGYSVMSETRRMAIEWVGDQLVLSPRCEVICRTLVRFMTTRRLRQIHWGRELCSVGQGRPRKVSSALDIAVGNAVWVKFKAVQCSRHLFLQGRLSLPVYDLISVCLFR